MSDAAVTYDVQGGAGIITLDSPHNRNALSRVLVEQLAESLATAERDERARAVVLTHTGGTFCAGADLKDPPKNQSHAVLDVLRTIVACPKPVIGQVAGHVRAGGMGLIGACDMVVATPASTFALTEVRLGLAASIISLTVLPRLGDRDAARLFLTGQKISGEQAAEMGLVTRVTDAPDDAVDQIMTDFRACSPQGLRETKALLNHDLLQAIDTGRDRVVEQSARLFASADAREGMAAFLERRQPRWAL